MDPIEELRTRVRVEYDCVKNVRSRLLLLRGADFVVQCDATEAAGAFASLDIENWFSMESFADNFSINILSLDDEEMVWATATPSMGWNVVHSTRI